MIMTMLSMLSTIILTLEISVRYFVDVLLVFTILMLAVLLMTAVMMLMMWLLMVGALLDRSLAMLMLIVR